MISSLLNFMSLKLRASLDSPLGADAVASLEPINVLAEQAPGIVRHLQSEKGNATALRP